MLIDVLGERILEIKEDNFKSTVNESLRNLDLEKCKVVITHFNPDYIACAKEHFGIILMPGTKRGMRAKRSDIEIDKRFSKHKCGLDIKMKADVRPFF